MIGIIFISIRKTNSASMYPGKKILKMVPFFTHIRAKRRFRPRPELVIRILLLKVLAGKKRPLLSRSAFQDKLLPI